MNGSFKFVKDQLSKLTRASDIVDINKVTISSKLFIELTADLKECFPNNWTNILNIVFHVPAHDRYMYEWHVYDFDVSYKEDQEVTEVDFS